MYAHVRLCRKNGELKHPYGFQTEATATIPLKWQREADRPHLVMTVHDEILPLYDPRFVEVFCGRMRLVGFEKVGTAWMAQEWVVEPQPIVVYEPPPEPKPRRR